MDFPIDIKNKIELEAEKYKISDLISSSKSITNKYKNDSGKNTRLVTSKIDVVSYAITRMPATFGALSFSMSKMLENIDSKIDSILDIGSGTGTSILVSNLLLGKIKEYTCIEREEEMINFSKSFISNQVAYVNKDSTKEFPNIKADLVIASYLLNELDEESCFKVLEGMLEASNKYLLVVDPGTPESFLRMRKIRDFFIKKGLYIISPCPHLGKCPILEDDWCHFSTRVSRSRLHKLLKEADVPYEDEKFSFLAVSKSPISNSASRILRHPLISPGVVKLTVCNKNGNIEEVTISKKNKELFKRAKKCSSGDKIDY